MTGRVGDEALRLVPLAGVAVRGGQEAAHLVAPAEAVAEELHLLVDVAGEEVEGRVVAEDLLDRAFDAVGGEGGGGVPLSRSAFTPLPIVWTVASWPALRRRMQVVMSSSVVSFSPSASAAMRWVMRSSAGRERRSST